MPFISVAAPVYNQSARTLSELVERLIASVGTITHDFEINLVDDGSTNDAWSTIERLAGLDHRVKGFRLARNFGQHAAITAALDRCNGEWVIVMDADLQDSPEVIPLLHSKAQEGFDVVFVRRSERPVSIFYKTAAAVFYHLFNLLSGQNYDRTYGNFSIVSANAIRAYRMLRESSRFYIAIIHWIGFRHATIDAPHRVGGDARSSYSFAKRVKWALSIIVGFSSRLLYLAIAIGLLMATGSLILACVIVIAKLNEPESPVPGWPSVITAIFFTAGITNVAIGLTGLYIGQILQQTKSRPIYIVACETTRI